MKIFVGNGSYFKYSPTSFDYADTRINQNRIGTGTCFAASASLPERKPVYLRHKKTNSEKTFVFFLALFTYRMAFLRLFITDIKISTQITRKNLICLHQVYHPHFLSNELCLSKLTKKTEDDCHFLRS